MPRRSDDTENTSAAKQATPGPRLPHERDQSADAQAQGAASQQECGAQAHADVERGLVDTDRGPVLERTYRERVRPGAPPAGESPRRTR